ncbi:MAG: late competence development ComFB family protein [Thermodesulfobacteriota bacterium]
MDIETLYRFGNTSLHKIRNRNELRVIRLLGEVLRETPDYAPEALDIEDIYALALNRLPAHYVQEGSIVLNDPVGDTTIRDSLREAIRSVRQRPNY